MELLYYSFSPVLVAIGVPILCLITYVTYKVLKIGSRPPNLPPGPPTQLIWGNLKQMNLFFPQYQYTEWAKSYGPVYTIMQGDTPHVVISGLDEMRDVFIKQGGQSAARPPSRFQLLMRDGYFPGLNNGFKWRTARKMWQSILGATPAKQYLPYQELETEKLLFDLLTEPIAWRDHIERYSNSVGMTMVNGQRIVSSTDPRVKETIQDLYDLADLGVRGMFQDFWPFLWKLPDWMFPLHAQARKVANKHRDFIWRNYSEVKERTEKGTVLPSINHAIQEKLSQGREGVSEIEGAEIGHHLLTGTTDTTASSLINWVAAMCLFPEAQRKAQEELDRAVGPNRLPRDEDLDNLPYLRQLILESQRWITSVPLSLPRAASGHVRLGKYDIPEGTGLIMNSYAIHSDPTIYPEPREFRPERWEGKLDALSPDRQLLFTFGAGRRICPGQYLAERSLFLVISHWLWAFDTQKAKDKDGNEIPVDIDDMRPGFIVCVNPFSADVKPRSKGRADLIRMKWREDCEELLDDNEQWKATPEGISKLIHKIGK